MWNKDKLRDLRKSLFCLAIILATAPNGFADGIQLSVEVINGGNTLDFGDLRNLERDGSPAQETQLRQVRLIISNTLGLPYVLSQSLSSPLVNESGASGTPGGIRFRIEEESGGGTLRTADQTPLDLGMQELYLSDDNGTNATLVITYEIDVSAQAKAGRYFSSLDYRVDVRTGST